MMYALCPEKYDSSWSNQGMSLALKSLFFAVLWCFTLNAASQAQNDTTAKRMQACTTCHGAEGITSNQAYFPRIAGKPAGYLFNQLQNFKEGRRHYGLMVGMVEHLSDAYLLEMAQYFANLDLPYSPPVPLKNTVSDVSLQLGKTLSLQGDKSRNIPACIACHGAALMGVQPAIPGLLGLPRDYLVAQLGAWQTGQRRAHAPDCMGRIAKLLKPADVDAVANWLALQPVPAGTKPAASLPEPLTEKCGGVP
jgi:cytochrome c553